MDWHTLAGPKHAYSTVARNSDGTLELFALTEEGSLEHCWQSEPGDSTTWSDWHSLGKGEWNEPGPHSFAVGLSENGCLELFLVAEGNGIGSGNTLGPNGSGQIFHNRQAAHGANAVDREGSGWTGWHTLDARYTNGWSTVMGATVVRNAEGLLDLFVMSENRGVLEEQWWSDYTSSTGIGHYQQTSHDRWHGPELRIFIETCIEVEGRPDYSCKSKLPVKLVAALDNDRRLELFANAGDLDAKRRGVPGITYIPAHLWHARQRSDHGKNWASSDFPMPPTATDFMNTHYDDQATQPLAVQNHEGNLEVFAWGNTDHNIWVMKQEPSVAGHWLPWCNIGDAMEWRHPIVVSNESNMLTLLAVNVTSNSIWYLDQYLDAEEHAMWSSDWQPIFDSRNATDADLLHAITNQDGRIELFASGPGNIGFRHMYQSAPGNWS